MDILLHIVKFCVVRGTAFPFPPSKAQKNTEVTHMLLVLLLIPMPFIGYRVMDRLDRFLKTH